MSARSTQRGRLRLRELRYAIFFCELLCIFAVHLSGPPPQWKQMGGGANEKRLRTPEPCGVAGRHVENDGHLSSESGAQLLYCGLVLPESEVHISFYRVFINSAHTLTHK